MTKRGIYEGQSHERLLPGTWSLFMDRHVMVKGTYLLPFVTLLVRSMPGMWKHRHRLMLCWLVVMHALFPERTTLAELSCLTLAQVTA
jgi:hypothetical protein